MLSQSGASFAFRRSTRSGALVQENTFAYRPSISVRLMRCILQLAAVLDKSVQFDVSVRNDRPMIENLKALAVFAKVVEHRSFRAAAHELGLSPSVASHHVSALERRLGVSLLYRSTRHLALTPDGEQLYASARAMIENAERGLDAAA